MLLTIRSVVIEERDCRDLHDAYCHHSKYLLKKAKELEEIIGCIVNPQTTPTWGKWIQKLYYTEDHQTDFNCDTDLNSSRAYDTWTGV